jgi:hypothetical protein
VNEFASQRPEYPANREVTMLDHLTLDSLLTRDKAAAALSEYGYPTTRLTLSTLASRGGGPVYRRYGRRALYRWADALAWAEGRCTPPRRSTSEGDAA